MLHAERALGNLGNLGDTEKHTLIFRSTQEIGMALSSLKEAFCIFLEAAERLEGMQLFSGKCIPSLSPAFFPNALAAGQRNAALSLPGDSGNAHDKHCCHRFRDK